MDSGAPPSDDWRERLYQEQKMAMQRQPALR